MTVEHEVEITLEGQYVKVISNGHKSYETMISLWTAIVEFCNESNCYHVLGLANSTNAIQTMEGYNQAKLFSDLGIDHKFRIAWVESNPEMFQKLYFVETVLHNRGLPGRIFADVDTAIEWLLNE